MKKEKLFKWLALGLLVTFVMGYIVSTNMNIMYAIFMNKLYYLFIIAQLGIAIYLGVRIQEMQPTTTKVLYLSYTALTGVTLSSIFILYEISSILFIFLATSISLYLMAKISEKLKLDLNKFGTYLFIGLISIIILELVNVFLLHNSLNMILLIAGVVIFLGYMIYDMWKINQLYENGDVSKSIEVYMAFQLYLDFVNLFIRLLSLFGKRRD